jgi:hypothetical protein
MTVTRSVALDPVSSEAIVPGFGTPQMSRWLHAGKWCCRLRPRAECEKAVPWVSSTVLRDGTRCLVISHYGVSRPDCRAFLPRAVRQQEEGAVCIDTAHSRRAVLELKFVYARAVHELLKIGSRCQKW